MLDDTRRVYWRIDTIQRTHQPSPPTPLPYGEGRMLCPFDPAILPQVEFGQVVIDRESGQLRAEWPMGDDQ